MTGLELLVAANLFWSKSEPWIWTALTLCCIVRFVWWAIRDVVWILVGSIEEPPRWMVNCLALLNALVEPGQPREARKPMFESWSWFTVVFLLRPVLDRVIVDGTPVLGRQCWTALIAMMLLDICLSMKMCDLSFNFG